MRNLILAGCLGVVVGLTACSGDDKGKTGKPMGNTAADDDAGKTADAAVAPQKIDRSGLSDVGSDSAALDYSDRRLWLCRQGNDPDECDRNLDATELLPDGSRKATPHVKATDPKFDCFYVYPTVKLTSYGPMTDFSNIDVTLDPLLGQGAPFNSLCRVYAPLYRQNGFVAGGALPMTDASDPTLALGITDVRAAFKYYLDHLSQGRKFVLIGHSQGTAMLMQLAAQDIDDVPAVRDRMISALLIGGNFTVASGKATGGTLKNIPTCTKAGEVGCVIAYSSFAKEAPPDDKALFGKAPDGQQVACTEPAMLAGNTTGKYKGSVFPLMLVNSTFAGDGSDKYPTDLGTPLVLYRNVFEGNCKNENGSSYLEIALDWSDSDPRPKPAYRNAATEAAGFGLHVVDFAMEQDDLLEAVKLQAAAALK